MAERLTIDRLGHRGDGIAGTSAGPVYVPFALPGETVEVEGEGERRGLLEIVAPSPDRVSPVCRHFGTCGGCQLQHLAHAPYLDFKRGLVAQALAQRGIAHEVEAPVATPAAGRRRAVLSARRLRDRVLLGYSERQSHRLVDIAECKVLVPELEALLPGLRSLLGPLVSPRGDTRVTVTATTTGFDIAVEAGVEPAPRRLAALAAACEALGVARLSVDGEAVVRLAEPTVEFDGIDVVPPPGAFLQASAAAEAAMAALVLEGVGRARRVADLYCGVGTFALRLARRARVTAVEGDAAALQALQRAAGAGQGTKKIETLKRDLERLPMTAPELKSFDAVVFDPPRAGARRQAEEIARADVERVVAVSCNPATLARDLRTLVDGGLRLERVVPVDQFVFSAHIECVALMSRR